MPSSAHATSTSRHLSTPGQGSPGPASASGAPRPASACRYPAPAPRVPACSRPTAAPNSATARVAASASAPRRTLSNVGQPSRSEVTTTPAAWSEAINRAVTPVCAAIRNAASSRRRWAGPPWPVPSTRRVLTTTVRPTPGRSRSNVNRVTGAQSWPSDTSATSDADPPCKGRNSARTASSRCAVKEYGTKAFLPVTGTADAHAPDLHTLPRPTPPSGLDAAIRAADRQGHSTKSTDQRMVDLNCRRLPAGPGPSLGVNGPASAAWLSGCRRDSRESTDHERRQRGRLAEKGQEREHRNPAMITSSRERVIRLPFPSSRCTAVAAASANLPSTSNSWSSTAAAPSARAYSGDKQPR